jgi:hypothetical protein
MFPHLAVEDEPSRVPYLGLHSNRVPREQRLLLNISYLKMVVLVRCVDVLFECCPRIRQRRKWLPQGHRGAAEKEREPYEEGQYPHKQDCDSLLVRGLGQHRPSTHKKPVL